ncbi:MAG: tol-pal system protein YbgF [Deltaproteobacteria bacterium]
MRLKIASSALLLLSVSVGCAGVATNEDVRSVYSRQINLENRVNQIYQDLEQVRREAQDTNDTTALREQLARIEDRIRAIEGSYSELRDALSQLNQRLSSIQAAPTTPPTIVGDTTLQSSDGATATPPENKIYVEAYKNLGEGKYKRARELFTQFLRSNPNSPDSASTVYWIAESYYREGKFEESILEFQKFIDGYTKDERVPLSYLKQGLALISIDRNEEAKLFLQTLIDKFPKSEEAKVAREKLKELARKN